VVDIIVGGASKAGTTALFRMLSSNQNFFLPPKKEIHYFSYPFLNKRTSGPGDNFIISDITCSFKEYLSLFRFKKAHQVAVDISPSYLFHYNSAEEIHARLGNTKLVFILRNPVEKIYSQYLHLVSEGRESLAFEDALKAEAQRKAEGYSDMFLYKESGYYYEGVKHFIERFGKDRVKIILYQDFVNHPNDVLQEICLFSGLKIPQIFSINQKANISGSIKSVRLAKFIGPNSITHVARKIIPRSIGHWMREQLKKVNRSDREVLEPLIRIALENNYKDDIEKLEKLIGRKTRWLNQHVERISK